MHRHAFGFGMFDCHNLNNFATFVFASQIKEEHRTMIEPSYCLKLFEQLKKRVLETRTN
jgi:hypothetical protein